MASAFALQGKRVLIVEDETVIAMALAEWALSSGAKLVEAVRTVNAALDVIASTDLDVAILDVHLRDQNAFLVADALVARHIPFIFETGYMKRRDIPVRFTSVPCLEKPFPLAAVFNVLEAVLTSKNG
jgi:CheY-like chemotaxis protein